MTNSVENLNKITGFILNTDKMLINGRGEHDWHRNITTSLSWSMAAAYNSTNYFLNNLNQQLAEAEEAGIVEKSQGEEIYADDDSRDRIRELRDMIKQAENDLTEIGPAYAFFSKFCEDELNTKNSLDPSPENIIPNFSQASSDINEYMPHQAQVDAVMNLKKINKNAMQLAITLKAEQDMESRQLMAKWSKANQQRMINELNGYIKNRKPEIALTDSLALRLWTKIDDKLADLYQKTLVNMLSRRAKTSQAAMQNIEHVEYAQEIAGGWVETYDEYVNNSDGKEAGVGNV